MGTTQVNRKMFFTQKEFIEEFNDDFRLINGKYSGLLISEVTDLNYLTRSKYLPWANKNPKFRESMEDRIKLLSKDIISHGLYFFFDSNKTLLYIGKSERDLSNRIFVSFEERQIETNGAIKYVKLMVPKTTADTYLIEPYLIKAYKPKLNVVFNEESELTIKITGLKKLPQSDYMEINYSKFNSHLINNHILDTYNDLILGRV